MRVYVHAHEVLVKDIKCNKFIVGWANCPFSPPRGFWLFGVSC